MKKLMTILAVAAIFTACNSAPEQNTTNQAEPPATENEISEPVAVGPVDPVCKMQKDATWTEYSVQGTDTTWFCSEHCKEAFQKDPSKYIDKSES